MFEIYLGQASGKLAFLAHREHSFQIVILSSDLQLCSVHELPVRDRRFNEACEEQQFVGGAFISQSAIILLTNQHLICKVNFEDDLRKIVSVKTNRKLFLMIPFAFLNTTND